MNLRSLLVIFALLLISCSTPNYRVHTIDGRYHDCEQVRETKEGWFCDQDFYPNEKVSFVVTSLKRV